MNKRKYKKKHLDYLSRCMLKHYVHWLNLYKREIRMQREQKQGKHSKLLILPKFTKMYITYYKDKLWQ